MTNTAPDDSADRGAGQATRGADELEDWLSDIRVNLEDDPPGWLMPEDDIADGVREPTHAVPDSGMPAGANGGPGADSPGPAVGRHRAAD